MKLLTGKIFVCLLLLMTLCASTALAKKNIEERKAELRQKTETTLTKLYEKQPNAQAAVENYAGYAVFNNTGFKLGIFGSAHGRGMAINNNTDQEVFMRMQEYQAGLGLGIKEYAVIFIFGSQAAWDSFVQDGWSFGAQATAAAYDGVNGDSLEGSLQVAPEIWMYQMTTKGLAAELAVKGTKYYRDKDYDED